MNRFLAHRLADFEQSDIRRMTRECLRVGGINLGQGLCDMPTPGPVAQGAIDAINARQSTYSYAEGRRELREAIAEKVARDNGLQADPLENIVVTIGSTGAFTCAVNALLNPGDGILLFEPFYGYHRNAAHIAGIECQYAKLTPPDFTLTEDIVRSGVKPNTRAVVICTPSNPSGKMFSKDELSALARVANERDLLVITDEIYEYIRYDGRPHVSPGSLPELQDRTVSIMGLSKTFSITGWRLGYAVASKELAQPIQWVNDTYYVCASTPLQLGGAAGFAMPRAFFDDLARTYQRKRDIICEALKDAGLDPILPQGAYYTLADVSRLEMKTAREAAMALLEEAKVASVPGSAFFTGATGEHLLRFCFAKEDEELQRAAESIRGFRA